MSGVGVEYARIMARYNQWMNAKLYALCAELSDAQRKQDRGAFFKSIHGTLNHLLLGDRIWMGRFLGQPFMAKSLDQELYGDFSELRHERAHTDADIIAWAWTLTDEKLAVSLGYTSIVGAQQRSEPLWALVMHFFNHQTHHRGQLTTLLNQCDVNPGITDLLWLPTE